MAFSQFPFLEQSQEEVGVKCLAKPAGFLEECEAIITKVREFTYIAEVVPDTVKPVDIYAFKEKNGMVIIRKDAVKLL